MKKTYMALVLPLIVMLLIPIGCVQPEAGRNSASVYAQKCGICHGKLGQGGSAPAHINCKKCNSLEELYIKIDAEMPFRNPGTCVDTCARDMARYIYEVINGNSPTE